MKNAASGFSAAMLLVASLALGVMAGSRGQAQETGDVIVVFELASRDSVDVDIGAQRLSRDGTLLWGEDGRPVQVGGAKAIETSPAACDDGQGGALVFYVYEFTDGPNAGDKDIVVQHLDRNGRRLWAEPKQLAGSKNAEMLPLPVSDGQGGAIVVYLWTDEKGDSDVLAQRIGPDGQLLWNDGKNPVIVGASANLERNACAVPDGQGGIFVFFEWVGENGATDIMGQHVTADGQTPWMSAKRPLDIGASSHQERHPVAVADGAGGAMVAFEMEFTSDEYRGDIDIMAQRVAPSGALLWGDAAHPKVVGSAPGYERNPAAIADGAGGIIVAFEMEPVTGENKGDIDILAQRLDADGKPQWEQGQRSRAVSSSPELERLPALVSDGAGGFIAAVELEFRAGEYQGERDVYAQRLSALGEVKWKEGKKSVYIGNSRRWQEMRPIALTDGHGGAIIVYTATARGDPDDGNQDIEAARVDGASGQLLWMNGDRSVDIAATAVLERNPSAFVVGEANVR